MIEKNESLPQEILDKIPKKREKKGYEIVRTKDSDEDETQVISLEELLGGDISDKKKKKDEDTKEKKVNQKQKKDRFKLRRKRKNSII